MCICRARAARIPALGTILQYSSSSVNDSPNSATESKGVVLVEAVPLLGEGLSVEDLPAIGCSLSTEQYVLSRLSVCVFRLVYSASPC